MRTVWASRSNLTTQMVLSFVLLALLTAAIAGLPGVWLIREQLRERAWAQIEQGRRAAQALYAARAEALASLTSLTVERPSLSALIASSTTSAQELSTYLETLRAGTDVDLLVVCDQQATPLARAMSPAADAVQRATSHFLEGLCELSVPDDSQPEVTRQPVSGLLSLTDSKGAPQLWLLAAQGIRVNQAAADRRQATGMVVLGRWLSQEFVDEMQTQTGLEHSLLLNEQVAASSLPERASLGEIAHVGETSGSREQLELSMGNQPFYAAQFPLEPALGPGPELIPQSAGTVSAGPWSANPWSDMGGIWAEVALGVANIVATQRRLMALLLGGILVAAVIGSLIATFQARRIARPLEDLAQAAAALSEGEFSRPLAVEAPVREVALVAQALENARADLQRTLEELRREKAWTDHLLSAIVEGIVTLDRQGRITFFSLGAERITAWDRDQVIGLNCDQVFDTGSVSQPFSALIPSPGRRAKIAIELEDGRHVVLAVTGARLLPPEGGDARVALVFRDISEEEAVHRLLSQFLANVSHEFRTPLSAIAASVELLLDQVSDLDPGTGRPSEWVRLAESEELLTSLHLGVLSLQKLVDNLLETTSIEAGRFHITPRSADLGAIIAEATRTMQPLLDKHGQHLVVELPAAVPVVHADPRRITQVLVNLLSNASRYGPDEAEIQVRAEVPDNATRQPVSAGGLGLEEPGPGKGWVRILVADQGPGIPPEYRQDLFRRFVPPPVSDGVTNEQAQFGFGLGLSVVKAIVEAHGGQVGVGDRPGGGSLFWFTLPLLSSGQELVATER